MNNKKPIKILIQKFLKIDVIDPESLKSVDYYVMEYDKLIEKYQNKQLVLVFTNVDEVYLKPYKKTIHT
jgi:hypothetical protein